MSRPRERSTAGLVSYAWVARSRLESTSQYIVILAADAALPDSDLTPCLGVESVATPYHPPRSLSRVTRRGAEAVAPRRSSHLTPNPGKESRTGACKEGVGGRYKCESGCAHA